MNNSISQYPALSFVFLRGFGNKPVLTQVSLDQKFIILSTHYMLTPIVLLPPLIESFVGTQASIANINTGAYKQLLVRIATLSESNPRIKINDALLIIRSFLNLDTKLNLKKMVDIDIDVLDMDQAIDLAIESDNLIRNVHHNFGELLKPKNTLQAR